MFSKAVQTKPSSYLAWSAFVWLPLGIVATEYALSGRTLAEKIATELLMPVAALFWIGVAYGIRQLLLGRFSSSIRVLIACSIFYILANPIIANRLTKSLERVYPPIDLKTTEPFDTVVILGGGTTCGPTGSPHLAEAGDRVGYAVRLYHQKLATHFIVTGDTLTADTNTATLDPSAQAKRILIESGVPESMIEEISGINTSQEMNSLKKHPEWYEGKRCGLITSGFHMPRAMKLANHLGMKLIPIVTDFKTDDQRRSIRSLLPNAIALRRNDLIIREYLGMLVGR